MALQIPRSQGPSVDPSIAPNVRVRPTMDISNFGGGRAIDGAFNQARGLSQDVQAIAFREEMRAQEAQANEIDVELGKLENQSREQLYAVQGGKALEAHSKMLEDYDKSSQEILKRATSSQVREKVGLAAERRRIALEGTTKGYVRGQMLRHEEEQVEAKVNNETESAWQAYKDPVRVQMALKEQASTLTRYGVFSNKPKEFIDAKILAAGSRVHRGVVSRLIQDGSSAEAQAYLEANKQGFTGADLVAVQGPLKMAALNQGALANADRIMNSGEREAVDFAAGKFITKEVGLDEAIEKSKEIEDLELRKQTQHELIRLDALRKGARQAAYESDVESAFSSVEKREKVPVEVLSRLKVTDRQSILSLERQIAKAEDRESDEDLLLAFHEQSPQEMAAMQASDLLAMRGKLSKKDYDQARELVLSEKRNAAKPDTTSAKLDITEMNARMNEAGLVLPPSTGKKKSKSETAVDSAKKAARSSALVEFRSLIASKKLTVPEQQEAFDEIVKRKAAHLLVEFKVENDYFDFDSIVKKAEELEPSDFEDDDWEIPSEVRKRIDVASKSVPNWDSIQASEKTVRVNMAYVATAQGQSEEFVAEVLAGTKSWPW